MNILTLENGAYELDEIPSEIDDLRFCVMDNSDPSDFDYFFIPLIFLESFSCPAIVMTISDKLIKMPYDWKVVIVEEDAGNLEVVPIEDVNDRNFKAFNYNPLIGGRPKYSPIEVVDIYQDIEWHAPKLKQGQILAVPLESGESPECVYFAKEITRNCEVIDFSQAW